MAGITNKLIRRYFRGRWFLMAHFCVGSAILSLAGMITFSSMILQGLWLWPSLLISLAVGHAVTYAVAGWKEYRDAATTGTFSGEDIRFTNYGALFSDAIILIAFGIRELVILLI